MQPQIIAQCLRIQPAPCALLPQIIQIHLRGKIRHRQTRAHHTRRKIHQQLIHQTRRQQRRIQSRACLHMNFIELMLGKKCPQRVQIHTFMLDATFRLNHTGQTHHGQMLMRLL